MEESIISNPFVGCTARDMKFEEVKQYWCNPFSLYNLNEGELFNSRTPIVIEGVRGSGKTMILKYLSFSVQKDFLSAEPIERKLSYIRDRSFGVYFRYKDDFCELFDSLDCNQQDKERIFKHYFELFIIRQMIDSLAEIYGASEVNEASKIISDFFAIKDCSLKEALRYVNSKLTEITGIVNSSSYDDEWKDKLMPILGNGNLVKEIVNKISEELAGWDDILFVVLLDEYENLGKLQTAVNTLLKQVDDTCNLTYRVGMRPAGMDKNNATYVGEEKLQVDRDFLLRKLVYEHFSDYKRFALDISQKRLSSIDVYRRNGLTDICNLLGKSEDFDLEANKVAKGTKQFKLIKKKIQPKEFEEAIEALKCDNKLLEMYNILLVSRGNDYRDVSRNCQEYLKFKREKKLKQAEGAIKKIDLDYGDKYRLTLLYMLLTIYAERKMYYSVNTFLYLSSGSINDFISLCRNVFKFVNGAILDQMINGIPIDPMIQTWGANDTAEDQLRKVTMSNKHGSEMYSFIENIGSIFEEYHRDLEAKYPETNQFAFSDENEIRNDDELNSFLIDLINSGAIIQKQRRQLKSVGQSRGTIYQINRIFAPIYQFSYRTRGGYNQMITTDQFREMLKKSVSPTSFVGKGQENSQYTIFDYLESEDGIDESGDV